MVKPPSTAFRKSFTAPLVALLLCSSCGRHDPDSARRSWKSIQSNLRHDRFTEALKKSRTSAEAWRDRPESEPYVRFRLLESETQLARGNGQAALAVLTLLHPANPQLSARYDLDSAEALLKSAKYDQAWPVLNRGLEASLQGHFEDLIIDGFNLKGQLLDQTGQSQEGEAAYRIALSRADDLHDSYWRARVLNNLGMTRLRHERYDAAQPYFERALAAIDQEDAPRLKSVFLGNLSICYNQLGNLDRALNLRSQALALQERMAPTVSRMNSYGEKGRIYDEMDEPRQAIEQYQRALDLVPQLHANAAAATWAVDLATADIEVQDWAGAQRANAQARLLDPKGEDGLDLFIKLNSAAIDAGNGRREEAAREYEQVASDPGQEVRPKWAAYHELGNLYAESGDAQRSSRCFEKAIALVVQSRAGLSGDDPKITFLTQPIRIYQDYVDALLEQHDDIRAMLEADSSRGQVLLEEETAHRPSARDLQQVSASSNTILVSYWITPRRSFAWVITGSGVTLLPLPAGEARIRELVTAYREELLTSPRNPLQNPNSAGWKLSDAVLEPVQKLIPAGSKVIVVPDGALHDINLETLPVSREHPRYWIEQVTLSIAPSLAVLATKEAPSRRRSGGVLIVGDAEPVGSYTKLPQAGVEIASVESRFSSLPKTILNGPDATAEGYREAHPERYALIHFATHAEANAINPLDSAIILSPSHDEYKLYARDIVKSPPLSAESVTISGCSSAGSKSYHGEGLIGFAWAFLHSGARNVIAGLWEADDKTTARIMGNLYAGLEAGQKPAEALRSAKLDLVHGRRSPYYWGPFQIYRRSAQ